MKVRNSHFEETIQFSSTAENQECKTATVVAITWITMWGVLCKFCVAKFCVAAMTGSSGQVMMIEAGTMGLIADAQL